MGKLHFNNKRSSDVRNRLRYLRHHRDGLSVEEIAKEEAASVESIRRSIEMVENYFLMMTEENLRSAEMDVLMSVAHLQKQALADALMATKTEKVEGAAAKTVPDHDTRMSAISKINSKLEALSSKGKGGVNTQVNVMTGGGRTGVSVNGGATFEDKLREIQQKRKEHDALMPAPPEIEYEGPEEEDEEEQAEVEQIPVIEGTGTVVKDTPQQGEV